MLDNLRNQASFQEEEPNDPKVSQDSKERKPRRSLDQVTHMTPQQRFALALMLLIIVVLLGVMLLFISGKVVPPFMS
jgi:cell division septal protein FtsQ